MAYPGGGYGGHNQGPPPQNPAMAGSGGYGQPHQQGQGYGQGYGAQPGFGGQPVYGGQPGYPGHGMRLNEACI